MCFIFLRQVPGALTVKRDEMSAQLGRFVLYINV